MKRLILIALAACSSHKSTKDDAAIQPTAVEKITIDAGIDAGDGSAGTATWTVRFSPKGGCEEEVAALIGTAKHTVLVAAYSFTNENISAALIERVKNNVTVSAILDRSTAEATGSGSLPPGSQAQVLKDGGVVVWIDRKHQIFHDKFIVVDNKAFETGSFNYTNQAQNSNAENCFVYHNAEAAKAYMVNWLLHQQHSQKF